MEVMEQITIDEWVSWKEDIRRKLAETARNFVYIGYRLKQIRDSGMYDGAEDIYGFAMKEYGLSKGTVSRFIAINEKFSEDGNSLELKKEYRAIGSSKLAEMLTLTDEECRLITEKTTVSQIREFKRFSRQEPEDGEDAGDRSLEWTPLQKCIIEYFRGKKEMLDAAMECIAAGDHKVAAEIISPNGNATFKKGMIFLFMYDYRDGVKYKTFGTNDVTVMSWDDFLMDIGEIFWPDYSMGINGYDAFYKESEQKTEKAEETPKILNGEGSVATSQQEEKEDKNRVEKMEDEAASESGTEEDDGAPGEPAGAAKPEDDADGAGGDGSEEPDGIRMAEHSVDEITMAMEKRQMAAGADCEDEPEDEIFDTDSEEQGEIGYEEMYIEIRYLLGNMKIYYEHEKWDELIEKAEQVIRNVEKIKMMEDE